MNPSHIKPAVATGVRHIIFDLGNVLLDVDIPRTVEAFGRLGVKRPRTIDIHPHNVGLFLLLETGQVTPEQFFDAVRESAPEGARPTVEQLREAWNAMLLPFDWRRFELLDRLRADGYSLFLLSNINQPHHVEIERRFDTGNPFGRTFQSYFDRVFYSDEMRMRKPDPEIFESVLQQTDITASETLFIDDNRENIETALRLGIRSYHLTAPETVLDLFENSPR